MTGGTKTTAGASSLLTSPGVIFLGFVVWALVLTYPLLWQPFTTIPRGSEEASTVPLFNLWTLQWNIDQLIQGFPNYWDAPIFAPNSGAFAFSEPQPLSGLLAAPLWLAFQSPALGYNTVVILYLTLSGWFTYWILRDWRVTRLPAFLAGLIMAALPFVAQEMGVLQLIAIFGFLWSLLFLNRLLDCRQDRPIPWATILGLALGVSATFLSCGYYGLFSLLFLPLFFLSQLRIHHVNRPFISHFLWLALLILLLSGPFLWSQRQVLSRYNLTRQPQIIENNSARLRYYAASLDYNLLYGQLLRREGGQGQHLFPGFGLMLLAGLGLWGRTQPRIRLYLIIAAGLALILSLGLRFHLGPLQPYEWVREYIPGFAQLRSPFRFAVLVQLHLALLAGLGLQNLSRWLPPQPGRWIAIGLTLLVLGESLALPLPLQPIPPYLTLPAWQSWLNRIEPPPQIVMLPFAPSSQVTDFEQTVQWMLENRRFRGRMLNGYSGFFPPDHARLREQMLTFPTPEGLALLREKQIRYVVVTSAFQKAAIGASLPLVYWDEEVGIYELPE